MFSCSWAWACSRFPPFKRGFCTADRAKLDFNVRHLSKGELNRATSHRLKCVGSYISGKDAPLSMIWKGSFKEWDLTVFEKCSLWSGNREVVGKWLRFRGQPGCKRQLFRFPPCNGWKRNLRKSYSPTSTVGSSELTAANSSASLRSSCANGLREKCELCRSVQPEVTAGK